MSGTTEDIVIAIVSAVGTFGIGVLFLIVWWSHARRRIWLIASLGLLSGTAYFGYASAHNINQHHSTRQEQSHPLAVERAALATGFTHSPDVDH